jgi:hypothetical protein
MNCGLFACVLWCNQLTFSMDLCARIWRIVVSDSFVLCDQLIFFMDLCSRLWRLVDCDICVSCNQLMFFMDLCATLWRILGCDICVLCDQLMFLWICVLDCEELWVVTRVLCDQLIFFMDLCAILWRMWMKHHFCNLCLKHTIVHQRDLSNNKCFKRCLRSSNVGSNCETLCLKLLFLME